MPPTKAARTKKAVQDEDPPPALADNRPAVAGELAALADYLHRIKMAIGDLRINELSSERLPMAHRELHGVVSATTSATHTILEAAEEIMSRDETCPDQYRSRVERRMLDIFEACAFHDLTGQRIARVVEELAQLEKRLDSFASAVDARAYAIAREADSTSQSKPIAQDDIDKLFP